MNSKLFFCFIAFITLVNTASSKIIKCASQPCKGSTNFVFKQGKGYEYRFTSKTKLSAEEDGPEYVIEGKATVSNFGSCDYGLRLSDVSVNGLPNGNSYSESLTKRTLSFSFQDGRIPNVCPDVEEEPWVINVQKAILSGFQVSTSIIGGVRTLYENDILGNCETTYRTTFSYRGTEIQKSKDLGRCTRGLISTLPPITQALLSQTRRKVDAYKCHQIISNEGYFLSVKCQEVSTFKTLKRTSVLDLTYTGQSGGIQRGSGKHEVQCLKYIEEKSAVTNKKQASDVLLNLCRKMKTNIQKEAPTEFQELVSVIRGLSFEHLRDLWTGVRVSGRVGPCHSPKLTDLFLDAIGTAGNKAAVQLLVQMATEKDISSAKIEHVFLSLAQNPRPCQLVVKAAFPLLKDPDNPRAVFYGVSAMANNFCKKYPKRCPSEIIEKAASLIGEHFECSGREKGANVYLQSLANIGYLPSGVIDKLVSCGENSGARTFTRVMAIRAATAAGLCQQTGPNANKIKEMLKDRARDNYEKDEVRIAAFKGLMVCSGQDEGFEEVIKMASKILSESTSPPFTSYINSYLRSIESTSNPSKQKLREVLRRQSLQLMKPLTATRNMEMTYMSDDSHIGVSMEADVVIPKGYNLPTMLVLTLDLPAKDSSVTVLEIGLNQEGIKGQELNGVNWEKMINEIYKSKNDILSRLKKGMSWSLAQKIHEKIHYLFDDLDSGAVWIKVDGNHIYYLDDSDIRSSNSDPLDHNLALHRLLQSDEPASPDELIPIPNLIKNMIHNPAGLTKIDCASGYNLAEIVVQAPSVSGIPLKLTLNMTLVTGDKRDFEVKTSGGQTYVSAKFWPTMSIAAASSWMMSIGGSSNKAESGIMYKGYVVSDVGFKLETIRNRDGWIENIKLDMISPNNEMILMKKTSEIWKVVAGKSPVRLIVPKNLDENEKSRCSPDLLGFQMCAVMRHPRWAPDQLQPFGVIIKQAPNQKGMELSLKLCKETTCEIVIGFDTPNSIVDRKMETRFKFLKDENGGQVNYKSRFSAKWPNNLLNGTGFFIVGGNSRLYQLDTIINGQRYMTELSITRKGSDASYQIIPQLKFNLYGITDGEKELEGLLFIKKGTQKSVKLELYSVSNGKKIRLAKSSYTQEGARGRLTRAIRGKHRTSFSLSLGGIKHNQWINFEATAASNSFKSLGAVLDYKSAQMSKSEKIKFTGKFSDKGTSHMINHETMSELTFTQWPTYNTHVDFTQILKKPASVKLDAMNYFFGFFNRDEKDELTVKWGHEMDSDERKISLKYKLDVLTDTDDKKVTEKLTMFIGPTHFYREYVGDYKWMKNKFIKLDMALNDPKDPSNSYKVFTRLELLQKDPMKGKFTLVKKCPCGETNILVNMIQEGVNKFKLDTIFKNAPKSKPTYGFRMLNIYESSQDQFYADIQTKITDLGGNPIMEFKKLIDISRDMRNKKIMGILIVGDKKMIDYNLRHVADDESLKINFVANSKYSAKLKVVGPCLGMNGKKGLQLIDLNFHSPKSELDTKLDLSNDDVKFTSMAKCNQKKIYELVVSSEGSPRKCSISLDLVIRKLLISDYDPGNFYMDPNHRQFFISYESMVVHRKHELYMALKNRNVYELRITSSEGSNVIGSGNIQIDRALRLSKIGFQIGDYSKFKIDTENDNYVLAASVPSKFSVSGRYVNQKEDDMEGRVCDVEIVTYRDKVPKNMKFEVKRLYNSYKSIISASTDLNERIVGKFEYLHINGGKHDIKLYGKFMGDHQTISLSGFDPNDDMRQLTIKVEGTQLNGKIDKNRQLVTGEGRDVKGRIAKLRIELVAGKFPKQIHYELEIPSQNWKHSTDLTVRPTSLRMNIKTLNNGKQDLFIEGKIMKRRETKLDINTKNFKGSATFDLKVRGRILVIFDLESKVNSNKKINGIINSSNGLLKVDLKRSEGSQVTNILNGHIISSKDNLIDLDLKSLKGDAGLLIKRPLASPTDLQLVKLTWDHVGQDWMSGISFTGQWEGNVWTEKLELKNDGVMVVDSDNSMTWTASTTGLHSYYPLTAAKVAMKIKLGPKLWRVKVDETYDADWSFTSLGQLWVTENGKEDLLFTEDIVFDSKIGQIKFIDTITDKKYGLDVKKDEANFIYMRLYLAKAIFMGDIKCVTEGDDKTLDVNYWINEDGQETEKLNLHCTCSRKENSHDWSVQLKQKDIWKKPILMKYHWEKNHINEYHSKGYYQLIFDYSDDPKKMITFGASKEKNNRIVMMETFMKNRKGDLDAKFAMKYNQDTGSRKADWYWNDRFGKTRRAWDYIQIEDGTGSMKYIERDYKGFGDRQVSVTKFNMDEIRNSDTISISSEFKRISGKEWNLTFYGKQLKNNNICLNYNATKIDNSKKYNVHFCMNKKPMVGEEMMSIKVKKEPNQYGDDLWKLVVIKKENDQVMVTMKWDPEMMQEEILKIMEIIDECKKEIVEIVVDLKEEAEDKVRKILVPMFQETVVPLFKFYHTRHHRLMHEAGVEIEKMNNFVDDHILSRMKRSVGGMELGSQERIMKKIEENSGIKVLAYDLENGEITFIIRTDKKAMAQFVILTLASPVLYFI